METPRYDLLPISSGAGWLVRAVWPRRSSLAGVLLAAAAVLSPVPARADEDLPVALHGEDHRPGGIRLCLDARRRGPGRRLGQAGDGRCASGLADLRQGDRQRFGRRPARGAPRRLHRRPPLLLGERAWTPARSSSSTSIPIRRSRSWIKTIDDFVEDTGGVVGPHGAYALPGAMLISGLSNAKDKAGGRRWWNTPTTASSSRPTGCRPRRTREGRRSKRSPTATAMTRASCRART